jgi:hypothetical protein
VVVELVVLVELVVVVVVNRVAFSREVIVARRSARAGPLSRP